MSFLYFIGFQTQYFFKSIHYAHDELFYTPVSSLDHIVPQETSQHLINLRRNVSEAKLTKSSISIDRSVDSRHISKHHYTSPCNRYYKNPHFVECLSCVQNRHVSSPRKSMFLLLENKSYLLGITINTSHFPSHRYAHLLEKLSQLFFL